ncbi:alpha/beta hydrolase family protein [Spongiimicrobium salis]|uniref:alpha/beta hydrolase family protein n=1 Tax=Spongiimicrobium salis TaxID=1667022 RepID=UPI00374D72A5
MKTIATTIFLICLNILSIYAQDISGTWNGTYTNSEQKEILFIFNFEKNEAGVQATFSVPTYRVGPITAKTVSLEKDELFVDVSNLGINYKGTVLEEGQKIEGMLTEGASIIPLVLKKGARKEMPSLRRPQEPKKPYPYYEEEVVFENYNANISLSGTFTRPRGNGKYPVAILISGSGPQDRDETFLTHKPFLVLADHLTRKGIAVLRYDDRGFGKSTGNHDTATTEDFATDVLAAIDYLASRNDIDTKHIGLIGHSEGGIIAPLASNKTNKVSFMVLLASTGIPGSELSLMQAKEFRPFPVPDEDAFEVYVRKTIALASSSKDIASIQTDLKGHHDTYLKPILMPLGVSEAELDQMIAGEIKKSTNPWHRYFFNYNPADEIEKLRIPVLSLNGSKDTQVIAKVNQEGIRNALIKGKNKDYTIQEIPNLNHLFQECETGKMAEYRTIEQTMAPVVLEKVSSWIIDRTLKK